MADSDFVRLLGRVATDYDGYGYVPLFPDDLNSAAVLLKEAADKANLTLAEAADAGLSLAQSEADRVAADTAAAAAAAVPAVLTNRTVGAEANDSPFWAMTRSTPHWAFGPAGTLEETAIDNVCWEFDATTRAPRGMAFAGARTNEIPNSRCEGATAGTPGTAPTGWTIPATIAATVSTTIVGVSVEDGIPYLELRTFGTPSSTTSAALIAFMNTGVAPASAGEMRASSYFVSLVGGTLTNVTLNMAMGNVGGSGTDTGAAIVPAAGSLKAQRFSRNLLADAGTSSVTTSIRITVISGLAVDFTIRVGLPQQELGIFASAPIPAVVASIGARTRAQGNISLPVSLFGNRYMRRQGTVIVEWSSASSAFAQSSDLDFFGIVSLGDTGANEVMGLLINPAHTSVVFRRTVGGAAQGTASVTITPPAANAMIRCAFSWDVDQGLMQVAAQGALGAQLTGQTSIPLVTHIMPGRFSTTRPLFGNIRGFEIRPFGTFGAALAALTI